MLVEKTGIYRARPIVSAVEEKEGTKRRVKYINPRDYEGGGQVAKSDTQTIQSLDAKYGSLLRALAGSKANGSPPAAVTSQAIGKDVAWTTFNKLVDAYGQDNPAEAWAKDRRVSVFKEIVRELGDGKDTAKLGPAEWAKIKTEIEERFSAAASGLIPF
jgi:hypothetical protein